MINIIAFIAIGYIFPVINNNKVIKSDQKNEFVSTKVCLQVAEESAFCFFIAYYNSIKNLVPQAGFVKASLLQYSI